MIRIFFDHQSKIEKNLWENRFFSLLTNTLKKEAIFQIITSNTIDESINILNDNTSFDIFCPTGLNKYYLKYLKSDKKLCLFITDMIYELFGETATSFLSEIDSYVKNKAEQIMLSARIIFPSNDVKTHFDKFYNVFEHILHLQYKVRVLPYFIDIPILQEKPIIDNQPYILYTNYRIDLIDYHLLNKTLYTIKDWLKENNIKFILTGISYNSELDHIIKTNDLEDYVILYDYKDIEELNNLYQFAICQICPEIIDSFGYNILEGYVNNCLTMLNTDNIIYYNIAKNNGIYFSFNDLVEKLNVIINIDNNSFDELINRQKESLSDYLTPNIFNLYKNMFKELYAE